jgi:hypothetical protein
MLCEDDNGNAVEVVVKFRAGSECTCTGLICELIASLLARDLDLPVPEPYLVDVDAEFHRGIAEPGLALRFQCSAGLNFGCRFLGPAYVSWPQLRSLPASLYQDAAEILAFDLIIQNPDRRQSKPNLLRKVDQLAIFDHEMSFSFLYAIGQTEYPWEGKGMGYVKDHIFYNELRGKKLLWDRLQGALDSIDSERISQYMEAIPLQWCQESDGPADRIQNYLEQAITNSGTLFQKISEVLV